MFDIDIEHGAHCGGTPKIMIGLGLFPLARLLTDKVLLPGVRASDELVNQEKPNVGAGSIEAFSYVAASMLIGWAI